MTKLELLEQQLLKIKTDKQSLLDQHKFEEAALYRDKEKLVARQIEELNDVENEDYDEEAELKNMFPDEDSEEGFDWTLED